MGRERRRLVEALEKIEEIEEREREREEGKKERCETRKIAAPSEIQRLQDSFVVVKE